MGNIEITDYIQFMGFNSKSENLYLLDRSAPTPNEKEILKNLPFMQGVLDFSMLLGDRVFENREITYTFLLLETNATDIFRTETKLKQQLMKYGHQKIYDTHDPYFYWLGKCKSVEAERDSGFERLKVTVVFDCYPYMLSHTDYFDDVWDSFDFNDDVANYTKYKIEGVYDFKLYNAGSVSVRPKIKVDSELSVKVNEEKVVELSPENTNNFYISLKPGINDIHVEGTGVIQFRYQKEVMG